MHSDPTYGAIPPYETAIIYTLRDAPLPGFQCVAIHLLGPVAGTLYEQRQQAPAAASDGDRVVGDGQQHARSTATPADAPIHQQRGDRRRPTPRHIRVTTPI